MHQRASNTSVTPCIWRSMGALGLAVLLVMLGLFGASPILHAELHHHEEHAGHHHDHPDAHDDHGCVVLLYAQGVTTPPPALLVEPATTTAARTNFPLPSDPALPDAPRLLPPGRAPPTLG